MWPWGHLAVGYLLYSAGRRWHDERPTSPAVFLLALGTQFPDLVDKPLAWEFGVLEAGRSLGHSVLVAVPVILVLYAVLAPRIGRTPVLAFVVGYLSHPLADLPYDDLLIGRFEFTTYLVWPLLPPPPYDASPSLLAHLMAYELGAFQVVELGIVAIALAVWYRDGAPGVRDVSGLIAAWRTPSR